LIEMPVIDPEKCNGCGLCIDVCACDAIVMTDGLVTIVETDSCGWCLQCEIVCPEGAISCSYEISADEK